MSWIVLVLSGVLEAVWATALSRSEGFSRLGPSVVIECPMPTWLPRQPVARVARSTHWGEWTAPTTVRHD